ncbi:hypothetical protein GGF46_005190 [Coemansia sp. RSA 552]|nr:hypothetical protein GGF46_005190 [Coemansia sp. RSA 552]
MAAQDTATLPDAAEAVGVEETTEWVEHEGREFYTHTYRAAGGQLPVATLTIVHGLGEHVDRYCEMAQSFARAGIHVLGFDQRGFGKTGRRCGRLGDNEGIETVCQDIGFFSRRIAQEGVPHFLFGHSMGGLNVLNHALSCNDNGYIRGVIASAPALMPGKPLMPPSFVVSVLHQVARFVPSIPKSTGITHDMLTSNMAERERISGSVEMIGFATLGTIAGILKQGSRVLAGAGSFKTPVLIIHATGDKATNCEGTRQFYANLPADLDKEFREFDSQYHELHYEEDHGPELMKSYCDWFLKRLD